MAGTDMRRAAGPASPVALAFAGMAALAVGMGIGRFAFTPVLPLMQADAGLTLAQAGWLAAANYAGYLAGALAALRVRAGAGAVVRVSLVATALLTAAMGMTDAPLAWFALRALAGVFSAWVLIFAAAWVLPALSARGGDALVGVHFGGVGFGTAVTGLACLALAHHGASSGAAWLTLGGIAAALALACWPAFAGRVEVAATPPSGQPAVVAPPGSGPVWPTVLCYGCFGFGYIIPATFIPAMARDLIPDPAVFGWAWPVFGVAAGMSTLVAGALHRRVSDRTIWVAGQTVMAVAVALPALWSGFGAVLLCALGVGGTFVVVTLAAIKEARRLAPGGAPRLMATMTAAFAAGQAAGPVAVALAARGGYSIDALLLCAAALLLAALVPMARRAGA